MTSFNLLREVRAVFVIFILKLLSRFCPFGHRTIEIKVKSIDELNENIKLQNRLLGVLCNQLKHTSADTKKEENL